MKYQRLTPKDKVELLNISGKEDLYTKFVEYACRLYELEEKIEKGIIKEEY
jgi:hypothetical protein